MIQSAFICVHGFMCGLGWEVEGRGGSNMSGRYFEILSFNLIFAVLRVLLHISCNQVYSSIAYFYVIFPAIKCILI